MPLKVKALVAQQREIVDKIHTGELSVTDAARATGLSGKTIYVQLKRAEDPRDTLEDRSRRPDHSPTKWRFAASQSFAVLLGFHVEARNLLLRRFGGYTLADLSADLHDRLKKKSMDETDIAISQFISSFLEIHIRGNGPSTMLLLSEAGWRADGGATARSITQKRGCGRCRGAAQRARWLCPWIVGSRGMSSLALLDLGRKVECGYGAGIVKDEVIEVSGEQGVFRVGVRSDSVLHGCQLIIATGLANELATILGVRVRWGRDVLHCLYCYGGRVRDRQTGVIATGPTLVHQALVSRQLSGQITFFADEMELEVEERAKLEALDITVVPGAVAAVEVQADGIRY